MTPGGQASCFATWRKGVSAGEQMFWRGNGQAAGLEACGEERMGPGDEG